MKINFVYLTDIDMGTKMLECDLTELKSMCMGWRGVRYGNCSCKYEKYFSLSVAMQLLRH